MADDVAALGISVDSSGLKTATDLTRQYESVARRTGETVDQVQKRFEAAATARKKNNEAAASQIKTEKELADQMNKTAAANDNVAASTAKATEQGLSQRAMWRLISREVGLLSPQLADLTRTIGLLSLGSSRLGIGFSAATITIAALTAAMVALVKAGIALDEQQSKTSNALLLTRSASGQTAEGLEDMANRFSRSGLASLQVIRDTQAAMLKFPSVGREAFEPVIEAAIRLSTTGFADTKDAAVTLSKALSDMRNASQILAEGGFGKLSAATEKQVNEFLDAGKVAEAQRAILTEVTKKTEELGKNTDTVSGQWTRYSNAVQRNTELWGKWLAETLNVKGALKGMADNVEKLVEDFNKIPTSFPGKTIAVERAPLPALETDTERNVRATQEAVDRLTPAILQEGNALRMTAADAAVYNAVTKAGIDVNTAAGAAFADLVRQQFSAAAFKGVTDQLKAQADAQRINAAASKMSAGESAKFVAAETAKAKLQRDGIALTKDQSEEIDKLASSIGTSTGAVSKSNIAWDINLKLMAANGKLTQEEAQIVQQLVPLYGENIPRALASTEAAQLKLINQIQRNQQAVEQFINTFVTGMIDGKNATQAFGASLEGLGKSLISIGSKNFAEQIGGSITSTLNQIAPALGSFGGPLGSIVAGVGVSLIGKLFGKDNKEAEEAAKRQAEELQKARDAWAAMTDQVNDFNRAAAGLVKGQLRTALSDLASQFNTLAAAAIKAQNFAAEKSLRATFDAASQRLTNEFIATIPRISQQLTGEGGLEGATSQAIASVRAFREQIQGVRDDFNQLAEIEGSFRAGDWGKIAQEAQQAALAMLDIPKPMSELVQTQVELRAKALALQDVLVELGMSADDAAVAIEQHLNAALANLQQNFIDDLTAKVNALAGGDWINQGKALFDTVQQMRADALALGVSTTLIDEFYIRSAQKIIDQNELTGDSFSALVRYLDLGSAGLHEFSAALQDTADAAVRSAEEIKATIQDFQDQLFVLQQDQTTLAGKLAVFDLQAQRQREDEAAKGGQALVALEALQQAQRAKIIADFNKDLLEQQRADIESQIKDVQSALDAALKEQQKLAEQTQKMFEDAVKMVEDARRTIQNFISGFLGSAQSFLSPQQQMQTSIDTFNQQLALARSGDQNALQGITGVAQNALTSIKSYFGSTAQGATLQQQILNQLAGLPSQIDPNALVVQAIKDQTTTQTNENNAQIAQLQAQLAQLQAQLSALNSVNANVNGVNTQVTGINTDTNTLTPIQTNTQQAATSLLALAQISSNTATTANQVLAGNSWLQQIAQNTLAIRQGQNQQNLAWGAQSPVQLQTFEKGGIVQSPMDRGRVPIIAHAGEMVMTRSATSMFRGALERMNAGRGIDNFSSARIEETLQRLISVVVMASESDRELLGGMAEDFRTMAKAERRAK